MDCVTTRSSSLPMPMWMACTFVCCCSLSSCSSWSGSGQERSPVYSPDTSVPCAQQRKRPFTATTKKKNEGHGQTGGKPEITRFKGLGEISPEEFAGFIGDDIRLEPVMIGTEKKVQELLQYYMGKNSMQRQEFIIKIFASRKIRS